jgi:hypothetical protein
LASQIQVVNAALRLIGTRRITALDQSSVEATEAEDAWDRTLDATLRGHPWNFAMKLTNVAASATAPAWGYTSAYPIPADCLRVMYVDGLEWREWQVARHGTAPDEVTAILANTTGALDIAYVQRITDVTKWDAMAIRVLELDLALELAKKITDSNPDVQGLYEMRRMALRDAKQADAVENPPSDTGLDDFILARGGVDSYWTRYI